MNMIAFEKIVPLIVAIISATALLGGYMYQRQKEKEAEIRKTRQDIYSRLATNITQRIGVLDRLEKSPAWNKARTYEEQYEVLVKDPEALKNLSDQKEIAALLCMYGTDDAIKAYTNWLREGWDPNTNEAKSADLGKLILALRKSIYPETRATAVDANMAIWNDAKHQ